MAVIGRWSGGTTTQTPGTTWAAPNGIASTEDRNDSSTYTLTSSTSTITLPSSGLANGYLVVGTVVLNGSGGRCNPAGRWIQSSGTGNFLSGQSTGYNRDANNNESYVKAWAFIDSPSASAAIQFQWQRDTDANVSGTLEAYFEVIPLTYDNVGMYESSSTSTYGGTTPNQVTGFSTVYESTAIRSGDTLPLPSGEFLALGSWYINSNTGSRTQRWGGFRLNSTKMDEAKSYAYLRNPSNALGGEIFSTLVSGSNTLDMFVYRGDGVAAGQGGADIDGTWSVSDAHYAMVVIQLPSGATTLEDTNASESSAYTATTFTASGASVTAGATSDFLVGANVSGASTVVSTGTRYNGEAEIHVGGTAQSHSVGGDYLRNNQGSQDTFGWSANIIGSVDATSGDAIDVRVLRTGDSGGTPTSPTGWAGLWAIDLDSLSSGGPGTDALLADDVSATSSVSSPSLGQTHALTASDASASSSVSSPSLGQEHSLTANDVQAASSVSNPTLSESHTLSANDVEAASSVSQPSIGQTHALTAVDAVSASSVSLPSLGQVHALNASDVSSSSSVSLPTLSVSGTDVLLANDVSATSSVSVPTLGQIHALSAVDVSSASSVSVPVLRQVFALTANDVSAGSSVSLPTLAEGSFWRDADDANGLWLSAASESATWSDASSSGVWVGVISALYVESGYWAEGYAENEQVYESNSTANLWVS